MGTLTGQSIVDKARDVLQDTAAADGERRWQDAELLRWLNEGQRQVAIQRPDASQSVITITLVDGTRQSVPSTALRLLDITRDMGADGLTPGKPLRLVEREAMDAHRPTWHTDTKAVPTMFLYDERFPLLFWVSPPANAGRKVEAIVSVSPDELADLADPITLDDIYEGPLLDWILFRCFSKDTEGSSMQDAGMHLQAFGQSLGVKLQMDIRTGVRSNTSPKQEA